MKHSVETQALVLHTRNTLVSQLWPIRIRATVDNDFRACDMAGWFNRSRYVALLSGTYVLRASQRRYHIPAFLPRRGSPRIQLNKMLSCPQSLPAVFGDCENFILYFSKIFQHFVECTIRTGVSGNYILTESRIPFALIILSLILASRT